MADTDKTPLTSFIEKKRRERVTLQTPKIEVKPIPWFKRPLDKVEFSFRKGKDGRYYVRHRDWLNSTWIGPYMSVYEVNEIIDSYVIESLRDTLDKKQDSRIHSLVIDDPEEFFEKKS